MECDKFLAANIHRHTSNKVAPCRVFSSYSESEYTSRVVYWLGLSLEQQGDHDCQPTGDLTLGIYQVPQTSMCGQALEVVHIK